LENTISARAASPLFTVILSTYNRRDLAPRAIKSVLGQTFSDFEFIIIDNGSTDDTAYVINEFKDARIRFLKNPNPTKSCDAPRNMGIEMARGAYTAFIDDDDTWFPQRLEKVNRAFEKNPGVAAVCHYENVINNGKFERVNKYGPWSVDFHEKLIYDGNCLSPCALTIKTETLRKLGGFDLSDEICGVADYEMWIRLAANGVRFYFIEEALGNYNQTGANFSTTDPLYNCKIAKIAENHIAGLENTVPDNVSRRGQVRLLSLYLSAARGFIYRGRLKDASQWLFKSARILKNPSLVVDIIGILKNRILPGKST
jgi:glycosyltransferase involved in cell wall biosynthesis